MDTPQATRGPAPQPETFGFVKDLQPNLLAGFLVFLIAMPLCLAIAKASLFPPIAGIWTAVAGGLICTFVSNSPLTIKGPAAGMIVIVAGCVTGMTEYAKASGLVPAGASEATAAFMGYQLTLGVGVVAACIQILFGCLRVGRLGDFFPLAAVHGLLASIGIIIMIKQIFVVLGLTSPKGELLHVLMELPGQLPHVNYPIAIIGLTSLAVLIVLPLIPIDFVKKIPAPLVVLAIAIPLGIHFDLDHEHVILFPAGFMASAPAEFHVDPSFLVDMPEVLKNPAAAFTFPRFDAIFSSVGIQFIILFSLIGSLESLLSAKAVDLLDPWHRKTDLDRDLLAVGTANLAVAFVGGLPMISEIVRSSANKNNGARSRYANLFHGLFLLAFVVLLPKLIHSIPLACLGAMLVFTGFRLASPREFMNTYRIGKEELLVFVGTIVMTLATDLLIGVGFGILLQFVCNLFHGASLKSLVRPQVETANPAAECGLVVVRRAAAFSNWLGIKGAVQALHGCREVVVDLSETHLVDHSVMEKLHELEREFLLQGRTLRVIGLDNHTPFTAHPRAARKRASGSWPAPPAAPENAPEAEPVAAAPAGK